MRTVGPRPLPASPDRDERAHRLTEPPRLGSIFNDKATDRDKGVFRFDAVKVVVADLDEEEREQLRGELRELLGVLG